MGSKEFTFLTTRSTCPLSSLVKAMAKYLAAFLSLRFNEDDDCGLLTTAPYCLTPKPTGLLALVRWARFFPILSEAALILIYAPRAAYGSTDMRRLCPGRIFLYLPPHLHHLRIAA